MRLTYHGLPAATNSEKGTDIIFDLLLKRRLFSWITDRMKRIGSALAGYRWAAVLVLLLFFGVVYLGALDSCGMFGWDEAEYACLARSLARGEGFSINGAPEYLRPPVLPLAGAAVLSLTTGTARDRHLKLATLLFSLLTLLAVYWGAAVEFGRRTGLAAAVFIGIFPAFWKATPHFLSEMPFMAFFTPAVVCFLFGLRRSEKFFYLSWLFFGPALLTRYTALLFFPIGGLFLVLFLLSDRKGALRTLRCKAFWLSALVGVMIVGPWLLRQQIVFGDALIGIKTSATQLSGYLPQVSMPWYFYARELFNMLSPLPFALLVLGIAAALWKRNGFALSLVAGILFILIWFSCYRYKEPRLVTSVLPFIAMLSAYGMTTALKAVQLPKYGPDAVIGLVLILAFLSGFTDSRRSLSRTVTLGYPSFLYAMNYLGKETRREETLIGAGVPQISWYTDRRVIDFPGYRDLSKALRSAEWVIVTNFERGQKDYVAGLLSKLGKKDLEEKNAMLFRDRHFLTVLIKSAVLLDRL